MAKNVFGVVQEKIWKWAGKCFRQDGNILGVGWQEKLRNVVTKKWRCGCKFFMFYKIFLNKLICHFRQKTIQILLKSRYKNARYVNPTNVLRWDGKNVLGWVAKFFGMMEWQKNMWSMVAKSWVGVAKLFWRGWQKNLGSRVQQILGVRKKKIWDSKRILELEFLFTHDAR